MISFTTRSHTIGLQTPNHNALDFSTRKGQDALNSLKGKDIEILKDNPFCSLASRVQTYEAPVKLNKIYSLTKI